MKLKDIILALLSPVLLIFAIFLTHILPEFIWISLLYTIIIAVYFLYNLIKHKDKKQIIYIIIALMSVHILIW